MDREAINEAYQKLFDVIETKVDERGNEVMYQKSDEDLAPNTEAEQLAAKIAMR